MSARAWANGRQQIDENIERDRERPDIAKAPQSLPHELLPVEQFPLDALPDAFRPWLTDVADRMQCPIDFIAVPLIVAAASLASRHVAIGPRRFDDWTETANLWALIVGRPGVMKSPAMRLALAPLECLEALAADAFNEATTSYKADAVAAKVRAEALISKAKATIKKDATADVRGLLAAADEQPEPTRKRYIVNAPSWEKLHALLAENPGLLLVRDEMSGWLREMGHEQAAEARSFFVQGWSGGMFTVDRIGRGTITARDMRLSIIGAIQPCPLGHILRAARHGTNDDGMLERFLVAWPDDPGEWRNVDRIPDGAARMRMREAFERLDVLNPWMVEAKPQRGLDGQDIGMPFLRLDDGAHVAFSEWRTELERRLRGP